MGRRNEGETVSRRYRKLSLNWDDVDECRMYKAMWNRRKRGISEALPYRPNEQKARPGGGRVGGQAGYGGQAWRRVVEKYLG